MQCSWAAAWRFFIGLLLWSCGEQPGYSFGSHGERVAEVAEPVDRYCERAIACAPRAAGRDIDFCRVNIIGEILLFDEECKQAFRTVVDCAERSPCIEFPVLIGDFEGGCSEEVHAFETCGQPGAAHGERGP